MFSKIYNAFQLIRRGHYRALLKEFKKRVFSRTVSFGLQRDLNDEFQAPSAKIEIQIRPLRQEDVADLLDSPANSSIDPRIITHRKNMVNENIPTCYVAITADNKPCYMQWLIGYNDNDKIEKYFKGAVPPLEKHEALLEGAYSNPAYRGLRIMPLAMSLIAEKAAEINVRWVNTFVGVDNIASLKGCYRSGFKPYLIRRDQWFLFHRSITFLPISDFMDEIFYEVTDTDRYKTRDNHQILITNNTLDIGTLK